MPRLFSRLLARVALLSAAVIPIAAAGSARADSRPAPRSETPTSSTAHAELDEGDGDAQLFACAKPPSSGAAASFKVSLKPDVELKDLVTWAMGFSCKKFLYGSVAASHTGKVTMITPGSLTAAQAWGVFEAALHSMGLTVIAKGAVLEIVESPSAKDEAVAIRSSFPDGGASVVRLLLRPEHADVADLAAALELVKSKFGTVAPLPKLGAVLVTDDADHVASMRPLVAALDRPATGDQVFAIPLAHVDAASVATTLGKLLDVNVAGGAGAGAGAGAGGAAPRMRLVADARSNALFVAGSTADYVRIKALAAAIDVDTGGDSGAHLIRLHHAHAKELAQTLQTLLSGGAGAAGASSSGAPTGAGAAAAAANAAARGGAGDAGGFTPGGTIRVTADEASNSLLVMASTHDAASLRALVDDMDAPVAQIYIEAMVLDVDDTHDQTLGASWHDAVSTSYGTVVLGGLQGDTTKGGLSSLVPASAASTNGLVTGVLGASVASSVLGSSIPAFGLLVRAATHDTHTNVLSSPHMLTVDNKPAKLSVGESIPYRSSNPTASLTGATVIPALIEHKDLVLELAITPHIAPAAPGDASSDRLITLDIKLTSNERGSDDYGGMGPTWKLRSLETTAVIHDEESLVLGGLVTERDGDIIDKVPLLGDIPVLGRLFRSTEKIREKSNLLIILTPHVLDDSLEAHQILLQRLHQRDDYVRAADDLERRAWEGDAHPEKMRGLLADIDATVHQVEVERAALDAIARPAGVRAGPIEPSPPQPDLPEAPPPAHP